MEYITTVSADRKEDKSASETKEVIDKFNEHRHKKHPIILFLYLSGCGPCNHTKAYWDKLARKVAKNHKHTSGLIAEINQEQSSNLNGLDTKNIRGFPHIVFINSSGVTTEYDNPEGRNEKLLETWISSELLSKTQKGGATRKTKRHRGKKRRKTVRKNSKQKKRTRQLQKYIKKN